MRPGQNRRMRGRNRTKGPNPLTRTYESNGPDVKIRGTAQHIADKYAQLARDSTVSGDPVSAENYLQHAEHYYRMIAAAQEAYRQQFGTQQRPFDEEGDDGEEDGFGYGPGERGQGGQGEDYADGFPGQPYEGRPSLERPQQARFDRPEQRHDRPQDRGNERQGGERGFDRQGDRGPPRQDRNGERFDRSGGERFDRNGGERSDRNGGGDRFDRNGARAGGNDRFERPANGSAQNGERFDRPERQDGRDRPARGDGQRGEGGRRDFGRNERPQGQPRVESPRFASPGEESREAPAAALPAFLTAPVRTPPPGGDEDSRETASVMPVAFGGDVALDRAEMNEAVEARPRRARRPRRAETPGGLELVAPPTEPDTSVDQD